MDLIQEPKRRGRRKIHTNILRADGFTPEQATILASLASESGMSVAQLKRLIIQDFLVQFGYTLEDQGLKDEPPET